MAITLKFGNISKRRNSTYTPTAAQMSDEISVKLKDGCSDTAPVFLLNATSFDYNYCQWGNRYYYITDREHTRNDLFTIHCRLDPLATCKSDILNTNAFVAFDTAQNTELTDNRISIKTTSTYQVESANFSTIGGGYFAAVSVVGQSNCRTFFMSLTDAGGLMNGLDTWLRTAISRPAGGSSSPEEAIDAFSDMATDAFRQLVATGSAKDCIRSAIILPLNASQITGLSNFRLWLGQFDTGRDYVALSGSGNDRIVKDVLTLTIPWQATDWRRNAPYHELYLYIPYVGLNRLPVADLIGETSIVIESSVDLASGDTLMKVYATSGKIIAHYNASLGVPMPLGSSNVTPMQMTNSILTGAQGAAASMGSFLKADIGGGIAGGLGAIQGIMNNLEPIPTYIGSNGGGTVLGIANTAYLYSIFHDTNVTPDSVSAIMGTPTREVKNLGSLTGFVQTIGASVAAAAEAPIIDEINRYLDSGVYIE